jgi:hypothetical protein
MGYAEKNLTANEQIVFFTKFHWWMWFSTVVSIVLLAVIFGAIVSSYRPTTTRASTDYVGIVLTLGIPVLGLAGGLSLLTRLISWASSELAVTNQRIIIKRGWIIRQISELNLRQFEACQLSESIIGRLLGYKTVALIGTGGTNYRYMFVPRAAELRDRIIEQAGMGYRQPMPTYPPMGYPPGGQQWQPAPTSTQTENSALRAQFAAVKALIQAKRYPQARELLKTINHPTAQEWLTKLDRLESQH